MRTSRFLRKWQLPIKFGGLAAHRQHVEEHEGQNVDGSETHPPGMNVQKTEDGKVLISFPKSPLRHNSSQQKNQVERARENAILGAQSSIESHRKTGKIPGGSKFTWGKKGQADHGAHQEAPAAAAGGPVENNGKQEDDMNQSGEAKKSNETGGEEQQSALSNSSSEVDDPIHKSMMIGTTQNFGKNVIPARQGPISINSTFGIGDRTPLALSKKEEEKRLERMKYNFDDMIVFEGGILADHESWGREMIFRDFVHYALYHYKWGYYPKLWRKYRQLMTTAFHDPIPFGSLRTSQDYKIYIGKQMECSPTFATPSTIFQPYYGWVIAEYFISTMRAKFDPLEPLIIYDIGAGSGAMALSILNFLAEQYPAIYERCEYHLIEMSPFLIPMQRTKLIHHAHHSHIHHISIHNWKQLEPRRCFILGMELMSSMPHDEVIWTRDLTCYQQHIRFDEADNLSGAWERNYACTDPLILRTLRYMRWLQEKSFHALKVLCVTDGQENIDPIRHATLMPEPHDSSAAIFTKLLNLHDPFKLAYLPTAAMLMLEVIAQYFPRHHAFFADYNWVKAALPGCNGPLIQVKVRAGKDLFMRRVADALLANAGMVDVCFPTNFNDFHKMYASICGEHKEISNMKHPNFWKTFGGDKTAIFATRAGFNPITEDFTDFQVFASHHPAEM